MDKNYVTNAWGGIVEKKDYVHQEFPRWMHHHENPSTLVQNYDEQEALGDDWHESKGDAIAYGLKLKKEAADKEEAKKREAEEKGVCHACGQPLPKADQGEDQSKETPQEDEGGSDPQTVAQGIGADRPRRFQRQQRSSQ